MNDEVKMFPPRSAVFVMKRSAFMFALLIMPTLLLVGCANNNNNSDWDKLVASWQKPWGGSSGSPDKEVWTIECNAYEGAGSREMADKMAGALKDVRDLDAKEVRVDHSDGSSRVFYGTYTLSYKQKDGVWVIELNDAILRDLRFIRQLALGDSYPFFSARPMTKASPDEGPAEWNLKNVAGQWTLQVGVTYPTQSLHNYKQAAVEWVRDLRSRGYEAYYYHDADRPLSSICVGIFNDDAWTTDKEGRKGYSPKVNDLRDKEEFKYNLENGHLVYIWVKNPETNQKERVPNISFLVEIPHKHDEVAGK